MACLNLATELMSGLAAPARTATPIPTRTSGTLVPAAILPCLTKESISGPGMIARSNGSPRSMRVLRTPVTPPLLSNVLPVVRSNSGRSEASTASVAGPEMILTSAACVVTANPVSADTKATIPKMKAPHIVTSSSGWRPYQQVWTWQEAIDKPEIGQRASLAQGCGRTWRMVHRRAGTARHSGGAGFAAHLDAGFRQHQARQRPRQ